MTVEPLDDVVRKHIAQLYSEMKIQAPNLDAITISAVQDYNPSSLTAYTSVIYDGGKAKGAICVAFDRNGCLQSAAYCGSNGRNGLTTMALERGSYISKRAKHSIDRDQMFLLNPSYCKFLGFCQMVPSEIDVENVDSRTLKYARSAYMRAISVQLSR